MTTTAKPVIFLATANDRDDPARYLRNLAEESRRIREALTAVEQRGHCELVLRPNATAGEILDVFQDARYRNRVAIFHFGGHANSYQLLLETAAGKPAAADAGGLARFLAQQRGLALVFLNGCSTAGQVSDLLAAGVRAVIATDQAVEDGMATEFAARFYRGLAGDAAIGAAFEEAQAAMQLQGGALFRHIGAAEEDATTGQRIPWQLYPHGAADRIDWSLPAAANDPLFGLPALPPLDLPDKPYRYLDWYRREDAWVFFGRGREIRQLYDRVTAAEGPPLVLLYGQSGVGKSSLLAAGLLPRLEGSHEVRYARRDQALGLAGTLAVALGAGPHLDLAGAWRDLESRAGRPLLVILDQVEELFTRPDREQPDEMIAFLAAAAALFGDPARRPAGRLILSFRKEWLAEIKARLAERSLPRTEVFLERLDREGIVEVVTGPRRTERLRAQYGLEIGDPLLPGQIADDLLADRESPVAPMLAILLADLWDAARARSYQRPTFDADLYHEFRSRGLSLDDFLGRQLGALHERQPAAVDSGLALDLLAHHTTPLGTAEQRTLAELEQTYRHRQNPLPALLQACRDLYLLVDPSRNQPDQPPASRLTHDTLAPHVRKRFDESDAPGQRARRILESRTRESRLDAKKPLLLGGVELKLVQQGAAGMPDWSPEQRELVALSNRRAIRIKWMQRAALIVLFILAAIPVSQQLRDLLLRRAAERLQISFPAATVTLGDSRPRNSRTYPPRDVFVGAYAIDAYEVSYAQYRLCMKARRCSHPREPANTEGFDDIEIADGDLPVVWVDAYQAASFCKWIGGRLPTEAEWERAARGTTFRAYPWGKQLPTPSKVNSYLPDYPDQKPTRTVTVAGPAFAAGVTPEGIWHLLGNVSEWTAATELCTDAPYDCTSVWDGVKEISTTYVRGGSWESSDVVLPADYNEADPLLSDHSVGFRCVQRSS